MRRLSTSFVALGLLALAATPAWAQGRGGFGGGGSVFLLANESVQQELKLDSGQAEKLRQIAQDLGQKMREQFSSLQDLQGDERRQKMDELAKKANEEVKTALKDTLKPEQIKRFEQIARQQLGVRAFADSAVVSALKLTDDQQSKIKEVVQEIDQKRRDLFQDAQNGGDRQAVFQKLAELNQAGTEKATALLTADQKKSWEDLLGKPFEVVRQRPNN